MPSEATAFSAESAVTVTSTDPPLLEIVLDPEPLAEVVTGSSVDVSTVAPIVEVLTEQIEPIVDIIVEEAAVVDILGEGLQGPMGATGPQGPQGPQGEQGPPGMSGVGASVDFVFMIPASVWPLQHNLGRKVVDVVTVDSNDDEMIGDIRYVDENYAEVEWYYPSIGRATVST